MCEGRRENRNTLKNDGGGYMLVVFTITDKLFSGKAILQFVAALFVSIFCAICLVFGIASKVALAPSMSFTM